MKKYILFFIAFFCLFFVFENVFAKTCTINGVSRNCPNNVDCNSDVAIYSCDNGSGGTGVSITDVNSCCKLGHNIKFEGSEFKKGCIVGEQKGNPGAYCRIDGKELELNAPMAFPTSGSLVGGGVCNSRDTKYYKKWGMICFVNTINIIADWLFFIMLTFAIILFILSGWYLLFAMGDIQKIAKGKNIIIFAIIGLLVAIISKIAPDIVLTMAK